MNNKQILESKTWYRVLKVIAYITLVASVLVPGLKNHITSQAWVTDAFINFFLWLFILALLDRAIYYIVFGKTDGKIE